jgi:uncharacterized membrane protein
LFETVERRFAVRCAVAGVIAFCASLASVLLPVSPLWAGVVGAFGAAAFAIGGVLGPWEPNIKLKK